MLSEYIQEDMIDMKISSCIKRFENEKEEQLTLLIIEIFVKSILKKMS